MSWSNRFRIGTYFYDSFYSEDGSNTFQRNISNLCDASEGHNLIFLSLVQLLKMRL